MRGLFRIGRLSGLVMAVLAAAGAAEAQTDCGRWSVPFGEPTGFQGTVYSVCSWDPDGNGPESMRIVAGGSFSAATGIPANNVAIWDGRHWSPMGTGLTGHSSGVNAVATWDPDGAGPLPADLVAAGQFTASGSTAVSNIARWDGTAWQPLGTGLTGGDAPEAWCLASWDPDGVGPLPTWLVAGGNFFFAGGTPSNFVAAWDGGTWRALEAGMDDVVAAVTAWDADGSGGAPAELVAGGAFEVAGSAAVHGVARWDGVMWRPCGTGVSGSAAVPISAIASWDPDGAGPAAALLIAAGEFTEAGGAAANRIASWDGSAWSPLGSGLTATAEAYARTLTTWNAGDGGPDWLLVGGRFTAAGGQPARGVAAWDGEVWSGTMGSDKVSTVYGLSACDPDASGPSPARLMAVGAIFSIDLHQNVGVAEWDGAVWQPVSPGVTSDVHCTAEWDPDGDGPMGRQLVAGGYFTQASGKLVNHIARWDGAQWWPIGEGFDGTIESAIAWDADGSADELIAGGRFNTAGATARSLAKWDGAAWSPLGPELGGSLPPDVNTLMRWDADGPGGAEPLLVVGGSFTKAGVIDARNVAAWDGTAWRIFGAGLTGGAVYALGLWDPDGDGPMAAQLVAAGAFLRTGTTDAKYVARWDGTRWIGITPELSGAARSVAAWDPDGTGPESPLLVVGGGFIRAGALTVNRIAAWNGTTWSSLGSGMTPEAGGSGSVNALASWSPIPGGIPQLAAGGTFAMAGGTPAKSVALWNGSSWRALGSGVDSFSGVYSLGEYASPESAGYRDLVVGGQFSIAGGLAAGWLAAWSESHCCPVDLNGDGVVDFGDYLQFLNLFEALDPRVDFSQDGVIDFGDYLEFLNLFDAGC